MKLGDLKGIVVKKKKKRFKYRFDPGLCFKLVIIFQLCQIDP